MVLQSIVIAIFALGEYAPGEYSAPLLTAASKKEYSPPPLAAASKKEYSLKEHASGEYSPPPLAAASKKEYFPPASSLRIPVLGNWLWEGQRLPGAADS